MDFLSRIRRPPRRSQAPPDASEALWPPLAGDGLDGHAEPLPILGAAHRGREEPRSGQPYLEGRYHFEQFFGDLARRRRTWQVVAICALALAVVLAVGFVQLATTQKVVPYIVELDNLGETRSVGQLALEEVPERAMIAALRRFIHNARTITPDATLLNARLGEARAYARGEAEEAFVAAVREETAFLEQMMRRSDGRYVEEISNILPVPGSRQDGASRAYRVTWRERMESNEGRTVDAFEGYFTLSIVPPETEEEILKNPFGIYVTAYTWSRNNSLLGNSPP